MKVELINFGDNRLDDMMEMCLSFYSKYLPVKKVQTEIGFDIMSYDGIELGSYGVRSNPHPLIGSWNYGTGCAEPRLSKVSRR